MGVIKCYITDLIDTSLEKKPGNRDDRRNVARKGREKGKNVKNLCEKGGRRDRERDRREIHRNEIKRTDENKQGNKIKRIKEKRETEKEKRKI
jgi:hypothetical protein